MDIIVPQLNFSLISTPRLNSEERKEVIMICIKGIELLELNDALLSTS